MKNIDKISYMMWRTHIKTSSLIKLSSTVSDILSNKTRLFYNTKLETTHIFLNLLKSDQK